MSRQALKPWFASRFTGLFSRCGPIPRRPHDPAISIWAGTLPRWGTERIELATGGAGWDDASAEGAGVGEAVERWLPQPLPQDEIVESSFAEWKSDEPALGPERWVTFHPDQYAQAGFPFVPWTPDAVRRWVRCRQAGSGMSVWAPEEYVFLAPSSGSSHRYGPAISTGMSCGRFGDPVFLRGLQEVIERDALVGTWWGSYLLEEHEPDRVWGFLERDQPARLRRPNLRYRFYRVVSPFSAHVTITTLEGEDREGYCFSAGSACRETRPASWNKSILEAVQGRHYVRFLKARLSEPIETPTDFAGHAVYFSYHPDRLAATVLHRASAPAGTTEESLREDFAVLSEKLGPTRPVLFRHLTPPGLLMDKLDYVVLRVLVPSLQPLHGHHQLPFLGGPLWAPRRLEEYRSIQPHPFP
jgi:thiazole/oxazole-forming peptide maturase SagD family component